MLSAARRSRPELDHDIAAHGGLRQHKVLADAEVEEEPLMLAFLRHERDARTRSRRG